METPTAQPAQPTFRRYKDGDAKPLPWQQEIFDADHSHKCPTYIQSTPPCQGSCPSGEDIRGYLNIVRGIEKPPMGADGKPSMPWQEYAWRRLTEANPFPSVMGRVCPAPCETGCNRNEVEDHVGINSVEHFLGDYANANKLAYRVPQVSTGKKVAVIGGGPAGLSCAYQLRRMGHAVTIFDEHEHLGGMMRYGIPGFRTPRDVLDAEIQRILDLGVTFEPDTTVKRADTPLTDEGFDAVFLAVGAHVGRRAYIPAGESARILDAVGLLHDMEGAEPPQLGRRVVVYGGGNTAIDAARTAKRLGAEEAVIVYRRTRERMPAHDFEVQEAEEEGILLRWLETITQADEGRIVVEKMELDETGFPQPTGETEELEADTVILALGQDADLSLLEGVAGIEVQDGVVQVGEDMQTGHPGIFAGGDMVPAERTVTVGIGHGKQAARCIDGWLRGEPFEHAPRPPLATFDGLNTWYYADAPRAEGEQLEIVRRTSSFDEVQHGLTEDNALFEARGLGVFVFLPGERTFRAPLHLGLPMLEEHRHRNAYVTYLHLAHAFPTTNRGISAV